MTSLEWALPAAATLGLIVGVLLARAFAVRRASEPPLPPLPAPPAPVDAAVDDAFARLVRALARKSTRN